MIFLNFQVRSQSESAALNKLAQQRNMLMKPRSLLDEFHVWQNSRKVIGGGGEGQQKGDQGQKQMGTGAGGVKCEWMEHLENFWEKSE